MKKYVLLLAVSLLAFTVAKAQPGYINTIAGGTSGNNILAVNAQLFYPFDVVIDKQGNIYISNVGNSIVQKIDAATGVIHIIAGNGQAGYSGDGQQATNAELYYPRGLAVDTFGNVYIADEGNSRIRRIDAKTGLMSTAAGGGTGGLGDGGKAISARLSNVWGVATDKAGNIYISDTYNWRVRKVTLATGIITTICGDGTYGNGGQGGPATDAEIGYSVGMKLDTAGNIYFADQGTNTVHEITTSGTFYDVIGDGGYGFGGDGGPATDASLYIPSGVAADDSGNLYCADILNSRVRKVTAATGDIISTIAGNGQFGFSSDGGPADTTRLYEPTGVAVDAHRNVYIADFENNRLRKVDMNGIITTVAGGSGVGDGGSALNAALSYPMNVSVDKSSNVYIADYFDNRVREISTSTGIISSVAGNGFPRYGSDSGVADTSSLYSPTGVAADDSGNVYILCSGDARIRKVNTAKGTISTIAGDGSQGYTSDNIPATDAEFYFAPPNIVLIGFNYYYYFYNYGLALDKKGNIYVADGNNRIRRIDAKSDTITTIAGDGLPGIVGDGGPATAAQLNNPTNIAFDDSGNIYVVDFGNYRVRKIEASTGIINTVAGGGVDVGEGEQATDALLYPSAVAVDSFGNIFIADVYNDQIREVDGTTGILTTIAGNGIFSFAGDGGPAKNAEMEYPEGLTIDLNNNIYVGDTYNDRVREINALPVKKTEGIDQVLLSNLQTYPNPTSNTINIKFSSGMGSGNAVIKVSDVTGRELIDMNQYINAGSEVSIDISSFPSGMYFVDFNMGKYSGTTKVVKQ